MQSSNNPGGIRETSQAAAERDLVQTFRAAKHVSDEAARIVSSEGVKSGKGIIYQCFARVIKSICLGLSGSALERDLEEFVDTVKSVEDTHISLRETSEAQNHEYAEELERLRAIADPAALGARSDEEITAALVVWEKKYTDSQSVIQNLTERQERLEEAKRTLRVGTADPEEMKHLGVSNGRMSAEDQIKECKKQLAKVNAAIADQEALVSQYEAPIGALKRAQVARSEARRPIPDEYFPKK